MVDGKEVVVEWSFLFAQSTNVDTLAAKTSSSLAGIVALSKQDLTNIFSLDRWVGVGSGYKRGALEICQMIHQSGTFNSREFWDRNWGRVESPTQHMKHVWRTAIVVVDLRLKEYLDSHGPSVAALWLFNDDVLECLIRQLGAAVEFRIIGDAAVAIHIIPFHESGSSVFFRRGCWSNLEHTLKPCVFRHSSSNVPLRLISQPEEAKTKAMGSLQKGETSRRRQ